MIKKIVTYSIETLVVGSLIYLFWYIISPPQTWITTTCIAIIWMASLFVIAITSGMILSIKGGFNDTEKAALDKMIPIPIIVMDIAAGIGIGIILFVYGFLITGIIYCTAMVMFICLVLKYRFTDPVFKLPELDETELVRYLLDKWEDYCEKEGYTL